MLTKEVDMKYGEYQSDSPIQDELTIVVNSCDNYADVLELFFKCFDEYWPKDFSSLVVNTESSDLLNYSPGEKVSKAWGQRLIDTLNKVDTDYVIMLFDDYLLEDFVDDKKIISALNVLKGDPKSSVFYLNAACVSDHEDDPGCDYRILKQQVEYRLNSVPSIWRRKDLISYTGGMDSPWSWEVFGSFRTFNQEKNFYSTSSQSKNIFNYNHQKGGGIYRGKWVREVVESKVLKYGLDIDFNIRGIIEFEEKVKRNLKWRFNFILLGYKAIGWNIYKFFFSYLKRKFLSGLFR